VEETKLAKIFLLPSFVPIMRKIKECSISIKVRKTWKAGQRLAWQME